MDTCFSGFMDHIKHKEYLVGVVKTAMDVTGSRPGSVAVVPTPLIPTV